MEIKKFICTGYLEGCTQENCDCYGVHDPSPHCADGECWVVSKAVRCVKFTGQTKRKVNSLW